MKSSYYYLSFITIIGAIHIYFIITHFWNVSFYISLPTMFLLTFLSSKIINVTTHSWNISFHFLISLSQIGIASLPFFIDSLLVHIILFGLFLLIEQIRWGQLHETNQYKKEIQQLQKQQDHFNETFRIVRSERHDFLKHVTAIHYMLENNNYIEARTYLDSLVDGYEETNLSIKGETGVVASILHQIYKRATQLGCAVHYDLDVPLSALPLSDKEKVSFISNILLNGLEACEAWKKDRLEQPNLSLQFYKRSGLFILVCQNNSLPIPIDVLDFLYEKYGLTTKGDDHEGLGAKIIHSIVEKNNGRLDFTYKDEEFTLKIKIPAIK